MLQEQMKSTKFRRLKPVLGILIALVLLIAPFADSVALADGGLNLSTAFPGVTVNAGDDVTFALNVENETSVPQNVALSVQKLPDGWEGYFQGNGNPISRVYVDDVNSKNNTVSVDFIAKMPEKVAAGTYTILLNATGENGAADTLQLDVTVSEQKFTQGKLTSQFTELQGSSTSSFKYTVNLVNNNSLAQSYSLSAQTDSGWSVTFASSQGQQISSLNVNGSGSETLAVTVTPPSSITAGKYKIPVSAVSANETLNLDLTVNVTGTYGISLSTPTGLLSVDAYAGRKSAVTLEVKNTGTADLQNISLTAADFPANWSVEFDQKTINSLAAGQSVNVTAYITAASNAITGDYGLAITAKTNETSSSAEFRVAVKTSTVWGIVGVGIIIVLVIVIVLAFKKFGRR